MQHWFKLFLWTKMYYLVNSACCLTRRNVIYMFFTFLCYKCIQYTFISFNIIVKFVKIIIKKNFFCCFRERLNIIQLRWYLISVFVLIKESFWNLLANWNSNKTFFSFRPNTHFFQSTKLFIRKVDFKYVSHWKMFV